MKYIKRLGCWFGFHDLHSQFAGEPRYAHYMVVSCKHCGKVTMVVPCK